MYVSLRKLISLFDHLWSIGR